MKWNCFKSIQGAYLAGIWSNQLFISQSGNQWDYSFGDLILNIRKDFQETESWFWRLYCFENEDGDDFLIIEEQETPDPLNYSYEPELSKRPMIVGSRVSLEHTAIKKVNGYGFRDNENEILTTLVIELEKSYVAFKMSGPIITAKICGTEIKGAGDLLFSM